MSSSGLAASKHALFSDLIITMQQFHGLMQFSRPAAMVHFFSQHRKYCLRISL
ncbi:unnamed protein product [Gongylonema pulchrum]|uniref:Uncharacterized protein n=1 Tax=Gongylonema pulchrum TaxID=637853 RepID=A0A3P6QM92_9BILA|nr:unnamed protein product [Gongylonema pulchrum]